MSSGFCIVWERRWVGYHEAFDAGGGQGGTPSSGVRVPTWHDAVNLRAFEVGDFTGGSHVVGVTTKAALSTLWTVDRAVNGEDFPAFVAEAGVQGAQVVIRVRAV